MSEEAPVENVESGWGDLSPEQQAVIENKGWSKPADAVTSYANASKLLGVPEEHIIRVPTDLDDGDQWNNVYNKLGRPEEYSGYEFAVPEGANDEFVNAGKSWMHEAGLNNRQASIVASKYAEFEQKQRSEYQSQIDSYQSKAFEDLKKVWGNEYDAKAKLVDRTAEEFGVSDEMVTAMRDAGLGADFMRVMEKVAMKSGEARYVEGEDAPKGFGTTPEQAKSQLSALNMDRDWLAAFLDRNHPGHSAAVEKKSRLSKIAYGQ